MKKKVISILLLVLLLYLLAGCSSHISRGDPVSGRVLIQIQEIGSNAAHMEEFVGSAVIAEIIVRHAAEDRGTVGAVCDAVRLVDPGIQKQLALRTGGKISGYPSTTEALQEILDRLTSVQTMLNCETLYDNPE